MILELFQSEGKMSVEREELKTMSCVVEHDRRDTVRTRSSVNRNMKSPKRIRLQRMEGLRIFTTCYDR